MKWIIAYKKIIFLQKILGMDQSNTFASKTKIKSSIFLKMNEKALDEMKNSTKVSDRLTDNPQDNTYIHCLSLPQTRIWIRY